MSKTAPIDASTLLATKGASQPPAGALQRGETPSDSLVDLNFKVPPGFKRKFKQLALDAGGLKNIQFLYRLVELYEQQGRAKS